MKHTSEEWNSIAVKAVRDLVWERRACVWTEIEAYLADRETPTVGSHIDPHHLSNARRRLEDSGALIPETVSTKGGRQITTYSVTGRAGRNRPTESARARKRLLYARYLGWAMGTETKQGVVGPALERAVHASIREAAPTHGYRVYNPATGQTSTVACISTRLAGGPLDNAYEWRIPPSGPLVVFPVEPKNLRDWIYPSSVELYQLLSKAAFISEHCDPIFRVVPVLVCRQAHKTLFWMAKEMGFHVITTLHQLIDLENYGDPSWATKLREVRDELGFDLRQHQGPHDRLLHQFESVLPHVAADRFEAWNLVGAKCRHFFTRLSHF